MGKQPEPRNGPDRGFKMLRPVCWSDFPKTCVVGGGYVAVPHVPAFCRGPENGNRKTGHVSYHLPRPPFSGVARAQGPLKAQLPDDRRLPAIIAEGTAVVNAAPHGLQFRGRLRLVHTGSMSRPTRHGRKITTCGSGVNRHRSNRSGVGAGCDEDSAPAVPDLKHVPVFGTLHMDEPACLHHVVVISYRNAADSLRVGPG